MGRALVEGAPVPLACALLRSGRPPPDRSEERWARGRRTPLAHRRCLVMLVGRELELARLVELLEQARSGGSATCVVRGEAGIGKSALLEAAVAGASGFEVLRARGVAAESEVSFAVLDELLWPLRSRVASLPERQRAALQGALGTGPPTGDDPFTVAAAVLALLSGAAEERPLLVCVDDAHWVDLPTLRCLAVVARRLQADQVLVLLGVRTWPRPGPLPAALEGFETLELDRLPAAAAGQLLDRSVPDLAVFDRTAVLDRAEGHPLALLELARSPELLGHAAGQAPYWRLEEVFLDQLSRLPDPCRRALELLAVVGGTSSGVFPALLAGQGADLGVLGPAEEGDLVVVRHGAVHFRHPLIQMAAYAAIAPPRRRALHQEVADQLSGATGFADVERRAWHRVAAAPDRDEGLAAELEALAYEALRRSSAPSAVQLLRHAADLSPDAGERARRSLAAAEQLQAASFLDRADELLARAAADAPSPALAVEVEHLRCRIDMWSGQPVQARDRLLRLAAAAVHADPLAAAVMYGHVALTSLWLGDFRCAADAVAAAEQAVPEPPVPLVAVLAPAALLDLVTGQVERGRARLAACHAAGPVDLLATEQHALVIALAHFADGDVPTGLDLLEQTVLVAREHDAVGLLPFELPRLAMLQFAAGQWHAALGSATEGLELAEVTGRLTELPASHAVLAMVAAGYGRVDQCRASAAAALEGARRATSPLVAAQAHRALGLLELGLARPREAQQHLEQVAAFARGTGMVESPLVSWLPDLVEARVRAGDRESAAAALDELVDVVASSGWSRVRAAAERCQGLLASDPEEAEVHLERAVSTAVAAASPFDQARSLLCLGQLHRRQRRRGAARGPLAAALAVFEYLGAESWAEQVRVELTASGVETERSGADLSALSPQELCVAQAAAEGLTNQQTAMRLFLSVRTVEFHLSNTYRKLGVSRRAQLVRLIGATA